MAIAKKLKKRHCSLFLHLKELCNDEQWCAAQQSFRPTQFLNFIDATSNMDNDNKNTLASLR